MTIDERLDRLVARHEALTQSVELLTSDLHEMQTENRRRDALLAVALMGMAEGIDKLSRIVESHERRLSRLEGE